MAVAVGGEVMLVRTCRTELNVNFELACKDFGCLNYLAPYYVRRL